MFTARAGLGSFWVHSCVCDCLIVDLSAPTDGVFYIEMQVGCNIFFALFVLECTIYVAAQIVCDESRPGVILGNLEHFHTVSGIHMFCTAKPASPLSCLFPDEHCKMSKWRASLGSSWEAPVFLFSESTGLVFHTPAFSF